jgi:hypothetical protein
LRDAKKPNLKTVDLLASEDIRHFDQDIRKMSRKQLLKHFGADSSGRLLVFKLVRNLIWQAYERIQSGDEPPIKSNIRTFWYLWIKPALAHFPEVYKQKTHPFDIMIKAFVEMTLEQKLVQYSDFDLADDNWENRRIGSSRPEVMLFSDKAGWMRMLRELHQELGVSVLTIRGMPSAITSHYTANHIRAALKSERPLRLIGIINYDPAGYKMAQALQEQLKASGFTKSKLSLIIHPKHYTKDEIKLFRIPIPKSPKTNQWLKETGGIDGKAYGLESESMPVERLQSLLRKLILKSR